MEKRIPPHAVAQSDSSSSRSFGLGLIARAGLACAVLWGSAVVAEPATSFRSIVLRSADDVRIGYAEHPEVTVPPERRDAVTVTVANDQLLIAPRKSNDRTSSQSRRPILIGVPALNRLEIAGSGDVDITLPSAASLDLVVSGSGNLVIRNLKVSVLALESEGSGNARIGGVVADRVTLRSAGAGDTLLTGRTNMLKVDATGAGDVDTAALQAAAATVRNDGAGTVRIAPAATMRIEGSGSGRTLVAGRQ